MHEAGDETIALLRLLTLARELLRRGRGAAALQVVHEALPRLPATNEADAPQARDERRAWQLLEIDALLMAGDLALAQQRINEHFPHQAQPRPAGTACSFIDARACLAQSRIHGLTHRFADMASAAERGLLWLPSRRRTPADQAAWPELRARLLLAQGTGLSGSGRGEASLAVHEDASALLMHVSLHAPRDLASELANEGGAMYRMGRLADAAVLLERSVAVLDGLFEADPDNEPQFGALQRMNLASVFANQGQLARAEPLYREGAARLRAQIRAARASAEQQALLPRLRGWLAQLEMNWAYGLFLAGEFDAAAPHYGRARRAYRGLGTSAPHLRDDEARTWVNQAHLLASRGEPASAQRLYARALKTFKALVAEGRAHMQADAANARFGLARMLARQGRLRAAAREFARAHATLLSLSRQGQLQHAAAWIKALADHADALLAGGVTHADAAAPLHAALAEPLLGSLHSAAAQQRDINAGLARLRAWPREHAAPWLPGFAAAYLGDLLERAARWLGECDPESLRQHGGSAEALVQALGDAARAMPHAPHLMADWFLRTRGLRAQRSALAEGQDTRLRVLRTQLARLRETEETLLARPVPVRPAAADEQTLALMARWRDLQQRCEGERARCVAAGVLPALLRLDAQALAAQLAPGQALLMLAGSGSADTAELWAIVLRAGEPVRCTAWPVLGMATLALAQRQWRQAWQGQAGSLALRKGVDEHSALAPLPWADADAALAAAHAPIAAGVQQVLAELAAAGVHHVVLVPSGPLQGLPYHELLAPTRGLRWVLYPSCGAWARCMLGGKAATARAPRWALAAPGAVPGLPPLPWATIEALLSLHLWPGRLQRLPPERPRASGVSALLALGHGLALHGNTARSGLALAPGQVLCAHDLPRIRHCRQLLLSSCTLGRVDEVHAEAMGFLSSSFGYQARCGIGWLVEVPDAEACLFSIAFQHALHARARPAWGEVFADVRGGIRAGRWPAGFGPWLARALPEVMATSGLPGGPWLNRYELLRDFDGGLFAQPPPGLRELVRWVTMLGD